jgi:DNA-binding NtrC family response regulator
MDLNPILIIDDDEDDLDMIQIASRELNIKRPIHFFRNGSKFQEYLKGTRPAPFLIISDLNLPGESGFDIKKTMTEDAELKYKSVPFIFWSTNASEKQIQYAYDLPAQGFFFKPSNFDELCDTLRTIIDYWEKSQHPKRIV